MKDNPSQLTSRREFMKTTGTVASASVLAGITLPNVHAAGTDIINIALVGCGGRGTGAAANALSVQNGSIKLTAMADLFEDRLEGKHKVLKEQFGDKVDAPADRRFLGFNAFNQAIDTLKKGDVVILTTPPAYRWVQFTAAIKKGVNVFMEKPVTVDGPTSKRMLALAEEASAKNMKVGVGLMVRHCRARQELFKRIQDGEIGDIIAMRAYRMHGPVGKEFVKPSDRKPGTSEIEHQIKYFHSFLWASGGLFSDYYIHQIDECCWMKNAWPIKAQAVGGRHFRGDSVDQNFDSYGVEYTFADGSHFYMDGRTMVGCHDEFGSYAHGSKGLGIVSSAGHSPGKCRTFKGQNISNDNLIWRAKQPEGDPYLLEWEDLIAAIREDKPYNEVKRGVEASLTTSMGRMAAHTGQVITFDEILNSDHEFAPGLDTLTANSPAPVVADAAGRYPIPVPGKKKREY